MFPVFDILTLILTSTVNVLLEPMFLAVLGLVGFQYWQQQRSQERMFGIAVYQWKNQVLLAAYYGILGGWLGSFLLTFVGVTVNQLGLAYIWPVAIALMIIHMRFLCFAYAGGLVAVSCVLFGWPAINVSQILSLVAVLHITESFLIAVSGRYSAVPVILRHEGRLVGAFSLQNFWPLPLILLMVAGVPVDKVMEGVIKMPDWWPLLPLGMEPPEGKEWVHMMIPVVAALGYTDIAVATRPSERRYRSAFHLFLYSLLLLVLAVLSAKYAWLQLPAALLSPLGHEFLIQLDNRRELRGKPLFVPAADGLTVLDTVPDSPARHAGLAPGDVLVSLYGMPTATDYELAEAIYYVPRNFTIKWRRDGNVIERQASFGDGPRMLGVILAPQGNEQYYVELDRNSFGLLRWLRRLLGPRGR